MNDTTELVKKLLRLCEVLQINLPMESIVDGSYFSVCQLQLIRNSV